MVRSIPSLAFAAALLAASPALAVGDPNDPDWPCQQRKVPELTLGALWTGPKIEPGKTAWEDDPEVVSLVGYLQQRRVPLDEATKAVDAFAEKAGADRAAKLTKLFAGLFERMNGERSEVMRGIVRFAKKQRAFADTVRQASADFDTLRNDPKTDFATLQARNDEVLTQTRVFEERQKALTYVCEVPVIIEQRLFALGRAISADAK